MFKLLDCLLVDLVSDESTPLFGSLTQTRFGLLVIELSHCIHVQVVIAFYGSVTDFPKGGENVRLCQKSFQPAEPGFLWRSRNWDRNLEYLLRRHLLNLCRKIVSSIPVLG